MRLVLLALVVVLSLGVRGPVAAAAPSVDPADWLKPHLVEVGAGGG